MESGQTDREEARSMESKYLQLRDASQVCGMKPKQMQVLCSQGKIPAKKVGGVWYVSREAIDRTFGGHEADNGHNRTGRNQRRVAGKAR
jgi:hypothetical protein